MNSKNKGNRFERKIGTWLTQWSGFKFERNRAGSGAWHSNKDSTSDITCTDERHAHRCKLSIECKNYKDIKFEHVLLGNKNCDILRFWDQAKEDAARGKKLPILCMRYNSMPAEEFFFVVEGGPGTLGDEIWKLSQKPSMALSSPEYCLYIFMASDILETVDYKMVHKLAKQILKR